LANNFRHTYEVGHDVKMGWVIDLFLHLAIVAGIVLVAIGFSQLYTATTAANRAIYQHLTEAGSIVLLLVLVLITVYALKTAFTLGRQSHGTYTRKGQSNSPVLLVGAAILALPFLYARVIYTIIFAFTLSGKLSPITGEFVIQVVLITVVQTMAALILLVGGLMTMNIARETVAPIQREHA
jgi:hypothetical protein